MQGATRTGQNTSNSPLLPRPALPARLTENRMSGLAGPLQYPLSTLEYSYGIPEVVQAVPSHYGFFPPSGRRRHLTRASLFVVALLHIIGTARSGHEGSLLPASAAGLGSPRQD